MTRILTRLLNRIIVFFPGEIQEAYIYALIFTLPVILFLRYKLSKKDK